jgi:hypothetical protein
MRERAVYMSRKLLGRLGGRCQKCIGWAAELCDGNWSYMVLKLELHCFSELRIVHGMEMGFFLDVARCRISAEVITWYGEILRSLVF